MLFIDLETFSELDLKTVSLDRYASHPSTRILMCAYAGETGPVEIWQESDGPLPAVLADAFSRTGADVLLCAWNVSFERTVLEKRSGIKGKKWVDAMILARYAGLPAGLKDCNRVPFFAGQAETTKETLLINKFCKPSKTGKPHNSETDPEDWALFLDYCKRDVHDTRLIWQWLTQYYQMPERVYRAWVLDQEINRRGMPVDLLLCARAQDEAVRLQAEAVQNLKELTGLENPNSVTQLLAWLKARGYPFDGLGKELVKRALEQSEEDDAGSKTSVNA